MPDFPIVDSHVHLYEPERLDYAWMRGEPVLEQVTTLPRFDAARGGTKLAAFVFVEVAVAAGQHLAEAEWVQSLADQDARLAAIVAHAPVERGAAVEADLERLARLPALRGIRRLIQGEVDPGMCLTADFIEGVRRVGRHGLTFDICIKHWGLVFATELVRRCPDTVFVLDHIGKPGIAHGLREPWWSGLRDLAQLPNVVCKISGVITEADHRSWRPEQVAPYVGHAIECFGFERVMFGSDWPVSELSHRYETWVNLVDETVRGSSLSERRALFVETARRIYRLP